RRAPRPGPGPGPGPGPAAGATAGGGENGRGAAWWLPYLADANWAAAWRRPARSTGCSGWRHATGGGRRSGSVTGSTRAPRHWRSAVRRRFAGFSLRFEAREAACGIGPSLGTFGNIQGTETRRRN